MSQTVMPPRIPGWKKIVSEGDMHLKRLRQDEALVPAHRAPWLITVAGVASLVAAYLAASGNEKLVAWLNTPSTPAAVTATTDSGAPAPVRAVVDESRFQQMALMAVTGNKAAIKLAELDGTDSMYAGDFKALPAEAVADFPPVGQPWPVDKVLRRQVGDVTWYGMRLVDGYNELAWLGARRVVDGKPTYYSVRLQGLPLVAAKGSEVVGPALVPTAINTLMK